MAKKTSENKAETSEKSSPAELADSESVAEETAAPTSEQETNAEPASKQPTDLELSEVAIAEAEVSETAVAENVEPEPAEDAPSDAVGATVADETAPEVILGSGAPAASEELEESKIPQLIRGKIDKFGVAMGTGRRKTSVARVRVKDGDGQLVINGQTLDRYFKIERDRLMVVAPLKSTGTYGSVDVWVRVHGGGTTGQTGAVVLGIARALQARQPELHEVLSEGGFLTRDGRMVERKKYGYKKARKSFQFSKR